MLIVGFPAATVFLLPGAGLAEQFTTPVPLQHALRMESALTQPAVKKNAWTAVTNAANFMIARKAFTHSEKIQMR